MASAFREEQDHDASHAATSAHAAAGNGHGATDNSVGTPLDNVSTADTTDHIISKPVRKELTREKLSRVASQSREWSVSHIKHKWRWYLLGLIIFLAILLPIVFLVVLPAVVQLIVNQQNLPVRGGALVVQDPNTIRVTLDSSFKIPPGLSATTNEFVLELYDKSAPVYSPFLALDVPPLHLKGTTNFSINNQPQKITNTQSLENWFGEYYDGNEVGLGVRGTHAVISLGALKSQPRLDKTITLKGLNGLRGLKMQQLNFLFPGENGMNIKGELVLPNTSPLSLSFGTIELSLSSGNLTAGSLTLKDITIQPGNHTQSFEGYLDLNAVISNLSGFLSSQSLPLGEGVLQLNATAKSVVVDGQHVTFLEKVLGTRPLTVNISVVSVLSDLVSGLLKGGGVISGNGPRNGSDFINVLSNVFSNQTLLNGIQQHWVKHEEQGSDIHSRSLLGDSTMWNLVKLGLKMKMMQK